MPNVESSSTRVVRRIAADPTSTALLLAGPSAVELWPGVRRVGEAGGRTLVELDLVEQPRTAVSLLSSPPRRTATAYVLRFTWTGPAVPSTDGTLTLAYTSSPGGAQATHAVLELDSTDRAGSRVDRAGLRAMAEGFLRRLARTAEGRALAA